MERKISMADLEKAVKEAYENNKSIHEGQVPDYLQGVDENLFGISVMLTDGRTVNHGDTQVLAPMGSIAKIGTASVLLSQKSTEDIVKLFGFGCHKCKGEKPQVGVSSHGLRAVSAVSPQNDSDGKWDILINNMINMMGSAPTLDVQRYERLRKDQKDENAAGKIADAGFKLCDDTEIALDTYTKLICLQATARQLANYGATVAADGVNPSNGQIAFDGKIAASIVSMVVINGPHHSKKRWMMEVGVPAKRGFGGYILAIMPGFGAIAAYSPRLDENGISVKAAAAIKQIANTLQLNVYASARVSVEK